MADRDSQVSSSAIGSLLVWAKSGDDAVIVYRDGFGGGVEFCSIAGSIGDT